MLSRRYTRAPQAVGHVRRTAFEGGCLAGGIIALEAHALHLQGLEAEAESKAPLAPAQDLVPAPPAKRPHPASGAPGVGDSLGRPGLGPARDLGGGPDDGGCGGGGGGGGNVAMGLLWEALAGLHRAAGDDVASRLCLTVRKGGWGMALCVTHGASRPPWV